MINSINMGWFVLDKYYKSSDEAPAYCTALLLHPRRRYRYIDTNWANTWKAPALAAAREIWANYKDRPVTQIQGIEYQPQEELSEFERLAQELDVLDNDDEDEDEFERFIYSKPTKIMCSPLEWWCKEEQRSQFPRLHQMAIDILSIPPMSDEAERVFSGVRRTISWDRARLGAWVVEILGHWSKHGLIKRLLVLLEDSGELSASKESIGVLDNDSGDLYK